MPERAEELCLELMERRCHGTFVGLACDDFASSQYTEICNYVTSSHRVWRVPHPRRTLMVVDVELLVVPDAQPPGSELQ
jgi:hypothetical protein